MLAQNSSFHDKIKAQKSQNESVANHFAVNWAESIKWVNACLPGHWRVRVNAKRPWMRNLHEVRQQQQPTLGKPLGGSLKGTISGILLA